MDKEYFDSSASKVRYTPFGIFVDQAGYTPERRKIAVMPFEADDFTVCDENGNVVFTGKTVHFGYDEDSGDTVCTADFSELKTEGSYRVHADGRTWYEICAPVSGWMAGGMLGLQDDKYDRH